MCWAGPVLNENIAMASLIVAARPLLLKKLVRLQIIADSIAAADIQTHAPESRQIGIVFYSCNC